MKTIFIVLIQLIPLSLFSQHYDWDNLIEYTVLVYEDSIIQKVTDLEDISIEDDSLLPYIFSDYLNTSYDSENSNQFVQKKDSIIKIKKYQTFQVYPLMINKTKFDTLLIYEKFILNDSFHFYVEYTIAKKKQSYFSKIDRISYNSGGITDIMFSDTFYEVFTYLKDLKLTIKLYANNFSTFNSSNLFPKINNSYIIKGCNFAVIRKR